MIRSNSNRVSDKNRAYQNIQGNSPVFGIYIGQVTATKDLSRTGRIQVFIASLAKDKESNDGLFDCTWSSPFAGSTDPAAIGTEIEKYEQTQKSYGLWMVPPDIGNLVLVCFGDGNTKFPFVISCLYPDRYNHMVPGMPAGKSYSDPAMKLPVAEKNKRDEKQTHNDATRPLHVDLAEAIVKQGLANDILRGAGTAGARRESPSEVFGILTPGPRDPNNFNHRMGGHQFIMDDNINSRMIRLRTAKGNQLMMDDTTGVIYIINRDGTAWVELTRLGDINFYAEGSVNFRSKGNFNFRADKNINIEAGNDVNIKAAGDNIGDQYLGIPPIGGLGIPPLGTGGNIRFDATADLTQYAGLNAQITASGGDIDLSAGSRFAATASGPMGVEILAATGPAKLTSMVQKVDILATAGISLTSAGPISETASLILMNSGGAPALPALPAVPAPQIGTQEFKDAPKDRAEFNRDAAMKGEAGATSAGQRTGREDKYKTIVTSFMTAEPWKGHSQFDPIAESEKIASAASPEATKDMPPNAVGRKARAPADTQTPKGSDQGKNYVDSAGNAITSATSDANDAVNSATSAANDAVNSATDALSAAGADAQAQVDALLNGIPNYEGVMGALNNFKDSMEQKLLEITGLGGLVAGLKAAIPPIRFPTSNALGQKVIGVMKQLTEMEAQLKQFGLDSLGLPADLNLASLQDMKSKIDQAKQLATDGMDFINKAQEMGLSVIQDGPSLIFEDAVGNKLVDFSNGIGDVASSMGLVADINQTWGEISGSITSQVNENQTLAMSEFARSVGTETFKNSNVLEALNKGEYHRVPNMMMQWVYAKGPGDKEPVFSQQLYDLRSYQASIFQTMDNVPPSNLSSTAAGETNFAILTEQLDSARSAEYTKLKTTG